MRRRFAVLALAAPAVIALPALAGAAPAAPGLTIVGSANSTATWTVKKPVTLSLDTVGGGMTVSGGKTYVGLAIHDAGGRLIAAAVHPTAFMLRNKPLLVWLGPKQATLQLQRGTYRVTLLADAPATVRVLTRGLTAATTIRTTGRAHNVNAAAFVMQADAPLSSSGRTRLNATAGSSYGVFSYSRTSAPSEELSWFCLRPAPSSCDATDNDFRTSSQQLSLGGESTSTMAMWSTDAPGGAFDAAAGTTTAATASTRAGFAMSIASH